MGVTTAYFIMVLVEGFVLCKPVQYNWDESIEGTCTGENTAYLVAGITNLCLDTFIVALPMPLVFCLQLTLSRRISVAAMFSLGALICVISLLRVIWLSTWDLSDVTYTVTPGAIYSVLEPTLGVVNSCLPTIRPAINQMFGPGTLDWSRRGTSGKDVSGGSTSHNRDRNRSGPVKGNITRDLERVEGEIPLHEYHVECSPERQGSIHGNTITANREFRVHRSEEEIV